MRRNKTMILYFGVMPDMIPAPQHHVMANHHKGLQCIVFKNKTMLSKLHVMPHKGPTADIARGLVSPALCRLIEPGTQAVELCVDQSRLKIDLLRLEVLFKLLKSHNREPEQLLPCNIGRLNSKPYDLVGRIMAKAFIGNFSESGVADNDQFLCLFHVRGSLWSYN